MKIKEKIKNVIISSGVAILLLPSKIFGNNTRFPPITGDSV